MLSVLRTAIGAAPLLAVVLSLLASGLGAGFVVGGIKDFWFEHVATPQIQQAQRAADTAEFNALAEEARKKRALEVFHFIEQATNHFYQEQAEDEAWHQAQLFQLQREIDDYARTVPPDSGRRIDQPTLDFLLGTGRVLGKPAVSAGRG